MIRTKDKRQKTKGKRQKAKGKRQKAKEKNIHRVVIFIIKGKVVGKPRFS